MSKIILLNGNGFFLILSGVKHPVPLGWQAKLDRVVHFTSAIIRRILTVEKPTDYFCPWWYSTEFFCKKCLPQQCPVRNKFCFPETKYFRNISFLESTSQSCLLFPMKTLYIIAYDISDEKRLNRVRNFLKGYSTGGQKSVYECFLTESELRFVVSKLRRMIFEAEDRVHIFQMDGRSRSHTLGIALKPKDPSYFFIG